MTISGVTEEPVEHDSEARPGRGSPGLPQRSAQQHLEPQLREERGAGHGTAFEAFTPAPEHDRAEPGREEADAGEQPVSAEDFRKGADRGRRGRHAAEPDD